VNRARLADVAALAGVSKGAASFALNGRPGVSEETRARVLRAAEQLGWVPHAAARVLAKGRTDTIGLVMNRPPRLRGVDPLFQHFLEGVQDELVDRSISLLIQVVAGHAAELATFEEWARSTQVDGLVLIDLRVDDDRPVVLRGLDLPAVTLGDPRFAAGTPTVWTDDRAAARELVEHLAGLGHRRIARVASSPRLAHSAVRTAALTEACTDLGLAAPHVTEPERSSRAAPEATRAILTAPDRPTAIVYENDVMAMAGMAVAADLGLRVPADLSVVGWDDTGLGRLTWPQVTSVRHDAHAQGSHAVRMLLALIDGETVVDEQDPTPRLHLRESTGPAPVVVGRPAAGQPSRKRTPNPPRG